MNRRSMAFPLVLALMLAIVTALVPVTSADNNPSANGNGQIEFDGKKSTFAFSAIQQKNGTVKGNLVYHQRSATTPENNISVHMRIDCLNIVGNRATITGVITKANPESVDIGGGEQFSLVGAAASMTVHDNGEGGNAPPDTASPLFVTGAPLDCHVFTFPEEFTTTNIQVRP